MGSFLILLGPVDTKLLTEGTGGLGVKGKKWPTSEHY